MRCAWILLGLAVVATLPSCSRRTEPGADKRAAATEESGTTDSNLPGESVVQSADTAGADSVPTSGPPIFAYLNDLVGMSPVESGLWKTQPLAPILYKVLGPRLETLIVNMQETTPIREENGLVYVTGNKKYAADKAALVVDTKTDALYVWLLVDGRPEEYQWGDSVPLPKPVLDLIERHEATP